MTPPDAEDIRDAETVTDSQEAETVLANLHLPALAEAGYLEWDPMTETIRQGSNFEAVVPPFGEMDDLEDGLSDN